MELTRRDAVAALAAVGGAGVVGVGLRRRSDDEPTDDESEADLPDDDHVRETMVAVAEVVYPSELSGIDDFVAEFIGPRLEADAHARGIREAVATLDDRGESWHDGPVTDLSLETRDTLLQEVGSDAAEEDPAGTTAQQVRYYVVNELLLALYASPTGGELVGIENPQGHPGGTESYQRGPQ